MAKKGMAKEAMEQKVIKATERLRDDVIAAMDKEAPDEWLKIALDDVQTYLGVVLEQYHPGVIFFEW